MAKDEASHAKAASHFSEPREQRNIRWKQWMVAAQAGDQKAYEDLLVEVSSALRAFLRKRLNQAEQVEDVLQETLMGIHKAKPTYDPSRSFATWVYAIARYKFTDYLRARERRLNRFSEDAEIDNLSEIPKEDQSEIQDLIEEALLGLKSRDRHIVHQLKIEGRSIKEVAQEMNMSESAVKVAAHRAYKTMKNRIEKKQAQP